MGQSNENDNIISIENETCNFFPMMFFGKKFLNNFLIWKNKVVKCMKMKKKE
jgi:hypothetical protein